MTPEAKYKLRLEAKYKLRLKAIGKMGEAQGSNRNGLVYFDNLTGKRAATLIALGAADPDCQQNEAPTFQEITDFLLRNPAFRAHGYVVGPEREDERIMLEGVQAEPTAPHEQQLEFIKMFRLADEFTMGAGIGGSAGFRAWYD